MYIFNDFALSLCNSLYSFLYFCGKFKHYGKDSKNKRKKKQVNRYSKTKKKIKIRAMVRKKP